jgi:hypothetical protein
MTFKKIVFIYNLAARESIIKSTSGSVHGKLIKSSVDSRELHSTTPTSFGEVFNQVYARSAV